VTEGAEEEEEEEEEEELDALLTRFRGHSGVPPPSTTPPHSRSFSSGARADAAPRRRFPPHPSTAFARPVASTAASHLPLHLSSPSTPPAWQLRCLRSAVRVGVARLCR
jgi:hypothetical protein